MSKKTPYPYDKFVEWLCTEHGKTPVTAGTYSAQARRIVRYCDAEICNIEQIESITSSQIDLYIMTQSPKSQTPYRRSWNMFADFMFSEGIEVASADLCRGMDDVPSEVAKAIYNLNQCKFPFRALPRLKWAFSSKSKALSEVCPDEYAIESEGSIYLMPKAHLNTIKSWGYPDREPTENDPLIPRKPHSKLAMPVLMMRRLAGIC